MTDRRHGYDFPFPVIRHAEEAVQEVDSLLRASETPRDGNTQRDLIIRAGQIALDALVDIRYEGLIWLALQRQILVRGWKFEEFSELQRLVLPIEEILVSRLLKISPEHAARKIDESQVLTDFGRARDVLKILGRRQRSRRGSRRRRRGAPMSNQSLNRQLGLSTQDMLLSE